MRAVVVSAWDPLRTTDGACLVLHHHLRHLSARHDVTVLTPEPESDGERQITLPEDIAIERFPPDRPPAVDYLARRVLSAVTSEPAHVHYVERRGLLAALRAQVPRADVVHLFGWGTAQLWRVAGGRPTLHVAVDPWSRNLANRDLPTWRRIADVGQAAKVARHERRHYPRLGAVVVVAPHDADWVRDRVPGARVEVVRNGVEPGPPPRPPIPEPVLGFHGAFEAEANVDAALLLVDQILPVVRERHPDVRVLLVGRDPPPVLRARRGPSVEITGTVSDVRPHLDRVAVYVAPMSTGTGLKNKVLEAMAAGLPVVATPLALAGIGPGAGLTAATGAHAVAAAVCALLDDADRRAAAGHHNRERVLREFTWEASARAIEDLWTSLVRVL